MLKYIKYLFILSFLGMVGYLFWGATKEPLFGSPTDLKGVWMDAEGKVAVELYPCRNAICGRVVWVYGDPNQRGADGNKVCGAQVLGGLRRTSRRTWDGGWIYNPLDRGRYSAYVKVLSPSMIDVTGYMGTRWFGQTFRWRKAPPDLKLCA